MLGISSIQQAARAISLERQSQIIKQAGFILDGQTLLPNTNSSAAQTLATPLRLYSHVAQICLNLLLQTNTPLQHRK